MARIQSFPDWFEFKSKVTTGSSRRAFEVPRYTQVGNAVPPLMAKKIGLGISDFLDIINKSGVNIESQVVKKVLSQGQSGLKKN